MGCPKKTVVRDEPSIKKAEEMASGKRDRLQNLKPLNEQRKEAKERELAKMREEEAEKGQAKGEGIRKKSCGKERTWNRRRSPGKQIT